MSERAICHFVITCDACQRQITDQPADTQQIYGRRVCASCGEVHNRVTMRELLSTHATTPTP